MDRHGWAILATLGRAWVTQVVIVLHDKGDSPPELIATQLGCKREAIPALVQKRGHLSFGAKERPSLASFCVLCLGRLTACHGDSMTLMQPSKTRGILGKVGACGFLVVLVLMVLLHNHNSAEPLQNHWLVEPFFQSWCLGKD